MPNTINLPNETCLGEVDQKWIWAKWRASIIHRYMYYAGSNFFLNYIYLLDYLDYE